MAWYVFKALCRLRLVAVDRSYALRNNVPGLSRFFSQAEGEWYAVKSVT